ARIGTNISGMEAAEIVDTSELPQLFDATLKSSGDLLLHKFNLGAYTEGAAAIVRIDYDAESAEQAREIAKQFKVNSGMSMAVTPYPIVVYDGTNMESANANITFNTETGKASFAFTVTDPADYGKDWYISTGMTKANAVIY